jgi:hypothetical protein
MLITMIIMTRRAIEMNTVMLGEQHEPPPSLMYKTRTLIDRHSCIILFSCVHNQGAIGGGLFGRLGIERSNPTTYGLGSGVPDRKREI